LFIILYIYISDILNYTKQNICTEIEAHANKYIEQIIFIMVDTIDIEHS